MTTNSEMTLNFLKAHYGQEFTKNEIAQALGIPLASVTGSINGLIRKGRAAGVEYVSERLIEVEVEPATDTRKAKVKTIRYETLTEAGLAYDPVAEEAAKAAEKERKSAQKDA